MCPIGERMQGLHMAGKMCRLLLFLMISLTFLGSCKKAGLGGFFQSGKSGGSTSASADSLKSNDRPSDSSGGVPGYLTLSCRITFASDGLAVDSSCVATDKQGKVNLASQTIAWSWQYTLPDDAKSQTVVTVTELAQESPYHVIYKFTGKTREELLNVVLRSRFMLSIERKGQEHSIIAETSDRLIDISPMPRYRFIRISFPSLKQPWLDTQELDIERLELKWENQWHLGVFSDYLGRIGPYDAIVSGSSYATDRNSLPYFAFQRGPAGNIWETAFRTYEATGQYNAIGSPQWLKIDFKNYPIALQGIRIDGGDSRDTLGSEGSPDSFYIEGSQDDLTWTLIEGSRQENIDTTNLATFEWDKR